MTVFTISAIDVITIWKSYRIGSLIIQQLRFGLRFSFWFIVENDLLYFSPVKTQHNLDRVSCGG